MEILIFIIGSLVLSYLLASLMTSTLRENNIKLKTELVYVKTKRKEENERHLERIRLLNETIDQYDPRGRP